MFCIFPIVYVALVDEKCDKLLKTLLYNIFETLRFVIVVFVDVILAIVELVYDIFCPVMFNVYFDQSNPLTTDIDKFVTVILAIDIFALDTATKLFAVKFFKILLDLPIYPVAVKFVKLTF